MKDQKVADANSEVERTLSKLNELNLQKSIMGKQKRTLKA
jgi:hypothetical protein